MHFATKFENLKPQPSAAGVPSLPRAPCANIGAIRAVIHHRYGGPHELRLVDIPVPDPKPGDVRVRVRACSVNLSDWEGLTGSPAYARVSGVFRPRGRPLGSDIVGTVDALGEGVDDFELGDRIAGDFVARHGGFAEYACVPASAAVRVPDTMTDQVAACLPQAGGIALYGTESLAAGERLLINGAGGGSGTLAIQLAKAAGAHVTAVDNRSKVEWLAELGVDRAIDYEQTDFASTGERWDRVLDLVATRGARAVARAVEPGGTYRAVGGNVRVLLRLMVGGRLATPPSKSVGVMAVASGRELTSRVFAATVANQMKPIIEEVLPLSGVPEALARTGAGSVKGKLVIRP